MPDIFSIEPPRWLQQASLGQMLTAEQKEEFQLRRGALDMRMGEQKLNNQMMALQIDQMRQEQTDRAEDLKTIPSWLQTHPTWQSRQDATPPFAKSAWGRKTLEDVERSDSQNSQRKQAEQLAKDKNQYQLDQSRLWADAIAGIDDAATQAAVTPPGGPMQIPNPQQRAQINQWRKDHGLLPVGTKATELAEPKETAASRIADDLAKARKGYREAQARGDTEQAQIFQDRITDLEAQIQKAGETITTTTDPATGQTTTTISRGKTGKEPGAVTTGAQTQFEERELGYEDLNHIINKTMQSLEPGFVGIRGKLGEEIFDKYLSQFNQNLARQDRIMARELVRVTAMTALRKISGDNTGRWTTQDKQVAEDAITDLSMGQSYSMIAGKLEVLKQSARDRGKQLAEKLKQPQPLWTYSDQELAAALDAKKITRDQFVQEYVSRYGPLEQQKSVTPAQ